MTKRKPKTIPEVFGLKPEMNTLIVNQPKDYAEIMGNWPFEVTDLKSKLDFAHLFVRKKSELVRELPELKNLLQPNGMIWVSWPKKSSGLQEDVSDNEIRDLALNIGLVDVKVCAVSDIWSGLKLVIPLAQRS